MRPLLVVMQAFGPYGGEQTLDFADLRGAGFFLITGPTGSGKTTVLDAMSFALYGVTSGGPENEGGRSGASMRSDHADPQLLTRVLFEFALGDDVYRIEREPEQERPKLRGEGTTRHPQAAALWRLRREADGTFSPDGAPLATGWTRVGAKAEELLGFRGEQFRQVVMLPQGRFQRLLEADSREREQILRALFDTGHYAAVEQALKDEAAALRKAAEKVATQRDEVLRQAEAEDAEDLIERRARLALEATEAATHADETEALREAAQAALLAGREAAARLEELAQAEAAVKDLTARGDEIAGARREHDEASRAATLADVARQAEAAAQALESRAAAAARAAAERDRLAAAARAALLAVAHEEGRVEEREAAADDVRRLTGLITATQGIAEARAALAESGAAASIARQVAAEADATWHAARERHAAADSAWRAAQAGLLAAELRDGEPCPVCGARDHPAPAALAAETPAHDQVERLRRVAELALATRDAHRRDEAEAETVRAGAAALVAEREKGAPAEYAEPAVLAAAIAAAEERSAGLAAALRTATQVAQAAEAEAAAATASAEAAAGELRLAEAEARATSEQFAARLSEAGFADEAAWRNACREPADVESLRASLAAHDKAAIETAERLRLARTAAQGLTAPDVAQLQDAAEGSAAAARSARDAAAGLAAAAQDAGKHLERLEELAREETALGARYAVLGRLADVANGGNARHLSFQRYVLGAFLDDVLVAASQRLHLMTKSRYRLERTERQFGGRAAAGLNLEVYDAWTGIARPVSTLSGGETFMAALSLALGLAEVVQAHSGGIRLDTVFVDEGFGSLDDESLDLAVRTLMDLNEGGRLVGIISHVSELRERIDARLEITADKAGSRARFVVP